MKNIRKIALLTVGVVVFSGANLVAADSAKDTKNNEVNFDLTIRYVDSFAAIRTSDEGKEVAKELDSKRMELTKEIKEMEQQFTVAAKDFQAKASTLSESGKEREQKKLVKMEREYKSKLQESDEDMKITMQSVQERLLREHNDAVAKYAKTNEIDLVFGPGGVVFSSEKANCTMDVIEGMNKNFVAKSKGTTAVASKDSSKVSV
ncbi:OmpH family outer membrane protein [bacterium]|nr:OmpH family outer membrane protein [bacterium]